jgi:hypothetical protein
MTMFRVGIVTDKGRIEAKNFSTRDEADTYILSFPDIEKVIHYRIEKDGALIETEQGKR